ncbi:LytR/AlgR family response regulator transcription factor [Falsibacillus pallidus]|uniref:LytR/AlgR family response regulator transcription factor n=1 Tax=Falsibacillus pallidus TaxID=493781 RepID=UPI003D995082
MNSGISVLLVDDEHYSRLELKHLLSERSHFSIIGEADNGESAVMKTIQLQPDVVFLDVEMPKMGGMEAAKALRELRKPPLIVFATAYPQFAAEAFRYEAIDYLLKPYDEIQLDQTIKRIEKQFSAPAQSNESVKPVGKLAVESEGEIFYLDPNEIVYIHREDKLTKIVTLKNEFDSKMPLKEMENRLSPFSFFRIHKSILVNLDYVAKLTPWFSGTYHLEMKGIEGNLSVSRNYVKELRAKLEI